MELSRAIPPGADVRRRFRHGALGALLMLALLGAAGVSVALLAGAAAARLPWYALVLGSAPALLVVLLGLLVASALLASFAAALRPTNWLLALGPRTVWIHLRSYLNAHLEGDDRTVLALSPAEIAVARRVRELVEGEGPEGRERTPLTWLELELRGVDCAPIAEALRRERLRAAPERSFLGIRTSTRFHHRPVRVPAPGMLHVEWRRGMLAALEERGVRVERGLRRAPTLAPEVPGHAAALVERGRLVEAVRHLAAQEGLPLAEARRRAAELERA